MCSTLNFLELVQVILVLFHVDYSFMLVSCWKVADANVSCIDEERQTLLAFKHVLLDDSGRLSSWGNTEDCCSWSGVRCNSQTGHVEMLDLYDDKFGEQPLRGEISTSLMELRYLKYLDLSYNDFNGSQIPEFFGSLTKLKYLVLLSASFSGIIPYQLGQLSSLQVLDLGGNNLVGIIPYQLGNLSCLQKLNLRENYLVGIIPYQLGNLSRLQMLWLGYNDGLKIDDKSLTRIEWISNLPALIELDLSSVSNLNNSRNWLEEIGKLPKLRKLWLKNCGLMDINILSVPTSHLNFSASLATLDLAYNKVTSSIFPWLFNLSSNLVELFLYENQLVGPIPDDVGITMTNLEVLNLSNNQLNGTVSDFHFHNLTKLYYLDLSYNSLTLKFSNNWVPPFQLYYLWLYQCKLGLGFPRWLRTQNNLKILSISDAEIFDSIPEWFWNLTRGMDTLHIQFSNITGTIPNLPLDHFSGSPEICLASNQIKGSIPSFLFNGRLLDISGNKFSEFFLSCDKGISATVENLGVLNLSNNKLSRQLIDCWSPFKSLQILDLSNNQISGRVPISMGSLFQIRKLIFRNNHFSGELPYLENCTKLQLLDLGKNELSGSISPSQVGENLKGLEVLILRMNKLDGNLPLHLCNLTSVRVLDLSFNNFTGPIPSCFNNLIAMAQKHTVNTSMNLFKFYKKGRLQKTQYFDFDLFVVWKGRELRYRDNYRLLEIIDFSHNQLSGEIPLGIGNLVELVSLNLSSNNLSGKIISELGQLKALEVLDLSRNHFCGEIPTSLAEISWLEVLDLSHNNLSGAIPIGTQLQSFNASCYEENPYLCGRPLDKICSHADPWEHGAQEDKAENDKEVSQFTEGMYEGMGPGFVTGLLIVSGSLLLSRPWRHVYFTFLNKLMDYIFVKAMLNVAKWRRWLSQ